MSSDYVAQREALVDLSVAYEGARDITRPVLCTAFGNVALGSVPPPSECVWPPDITQAEADSRLRAVQHFLAQTEAVFKNVLRDIEAAQDRLVNSGFDVPRSRIITDPLHSIRGWYLRACGVEEIVQNAASEDSALQVIVEELSIDVRLLKGDGEDQTTSNGSIDEFRKVNNDLTAQIEKSTTDIVNVVGKSKVEVLASQTANAETAKTAADDAASRSEALAETVDRTESKVTDGQLQLGTGLASTHEKLDCITETLDDMESTGAGSHDDPSAYTAAKDLWPSQFDNYPEFKRWLDTTSESDIRRRKPSTQRLEIHAADWIRYHAEKDRKRSEALGSEALQEFLADTAATKAEIREKNRQK